jgi:hypothetical protein
MNTCRIRISRHHFDELSEHLFPGDRDEHGAVLLAGMAETRGGLRLLVREVHRASKGDDYVEGTYGYRALAPRFIHRMITRARDHRLAYLAVHNHDSDLHVGFSGIDMESHERGYPALLQVSRGMPVGALVFGRRSVEADVWLAGNRRLSLADVTIVGGRVDKLRPQPEPAPSGIADRHERQIRMFGAAGQRQLAMATVAVVGLGGIGSLVVEYLARLGVGEFVLVDPDRVERSNLSRIVGAREEDAEAHSLKTDVATRVALESNPKARVNAIADDIAKESVVRNLMDCDYVFIAADSMRARLVCNAVVHQYLIPAVQVGSKIRAQKDGDLADVFSANRPVRPGRGCLWCNQLIDPTELAKEAKTDEDRKAQAYGVDEPNPSVISLNAISAAHAVNDFLLDYLGLRAEPDEIRYEHFHPLQFKRALVAPRRDAQCSECSPEGLRFAQGDGVSLPCTEG